MAFLKGWFTKVCHFVIKHYEKSDRTKSQKPEEDYETILAKLADDVQKRQTGLSEIRLRERRASLLVTLYALAGWVLYVSIWYIEALPKFGEEKTPRDRKFAKAVKGLPVVIGPIV